MTRPRKRCHCTTRSQRARRRHGSSRSRPLDARTRSSQTSTRPSSIVARSTQARHCRRSREATSEAHGRSEWLRLSLGYAVTRFRQGAMRDCIERCNNVVDAARASGDLAELAHAYYLLHLAYTSVGSHERTAVRDLALPIYEELGDLLGQANALNHLGIDAYYEGRWD